MNREHAGNALETAVMVTAAGRRPHDAVQAAPRVPLTEASAASSATTAEVIK
jgi:hypothetical protein